MPQAVRPAEPEEDAAIVQRVRAGDRAAFDTLVTKYQRSIYAVVLRTVKNPAEAKDLAQRAFVRAFTKLDNFRAQASFHTWLYRIAINLSLNHLRDRKHTVDVQEATLRTEAVGTSRMIQDETRSALRHAISQLPDRQRQVLELRVYDELPFREVAKIVGSSENSAKVNFHHAVTHLRKSMATGSARDDEDASND